MVIGKLEIRAILRDARSLKDKRQTVKSLKDRIRNRFNASIAETEANDYIQSVELGICVVSNDKGHANSMLSNIFNFIMNSGKVEIVDHTMEFFS
jgi:uncharacterized protein YlxP (DUF503 family)